MADEHRYFLELDHDELRLLWYAFGSLVPGQPLDSMVEHTELALSYLNKLDVDKAVNLSLKMRELHDIIHKNEGRTIGTCTKKDGVPL